MTPIDLLGQNAAEPSSFGPTIKNVPAVSPNSTRPRRRPRLVWPGVFEVPAAQRFWAIRALKAQATPRKVDGEKRFGAVLACSGNKTLRIEDEDDYD